jgi:hypothetical protein
MVKNGCDESFIPSATFKTTRVDGRMVGQNLNMERKLLFFFSLSYLDFIHCIPAPLSLGAKLFSLTQRPIRRLCEPAWPHRRS